MESCRPRTAGKRCGRATIYVNRCLGALDDECARWRAFWATYFRVNRRKPRQLRTLLQTAYSGFWGWCIQRRHVYGNQFGCSRAASNVYLLFTFLIQRLQEVLQRYLGRACDKRKDVLRLDCAANAQRQTTARGQRNCVCYHDGSVMVVFFVFWLTQPQRTGAEKCA